MEDNELKHWVAFTRIPHVGPARIRLMEQHFGTLEKAWHAGLTELRAAGLDSRTARSIATRKLATDPDDELRHLSDGDARAITWHDEEYPARLKEIYDPPPVLYVRGALTPEDQRSVAVVGTRRATAYGREIAHRLSFDMAQAGVTIVSGLAYGIDAVAHRAALDAGARTIAVVASGVDVVYPQAHLNLAADILQNGALVSEIPWDLGRVRRTFPAGIES